MATKKFRPVTPSQRKKKQEEIVMVESQFVTKVEEIDKNIE